MTPLGCLRWSKDLGISRLSITSWCPLVDFIIIITAIYFNLFYAKLGFAPCMKSFHTSLNIAHSGCNPSILMSKHFHTLPKFSFPCPHISPPPPPHFYRPTPNHPHFQALNVQTTQSSIYFHAPNVQTTSICHISATLWTPGRLHKSTLRSMRLCPSATLHTSILPSYYAPNALSRLYAVFSLHHPCAHVHVHTQIPQCPQNHLPMLPIQRFLRINKGHS